MTPTEEESKQAQGSMSSIEHEFARGLRFTHLLTLTIQRQENETMRLIEELNRLLIAKGILSNTAWTETLENPTQIPPDFLP